MLRNEINKALLKETQMHLKTNKSNQYYPNYYFQVNCYLPIISFNPKTAVILY